MTLASNPGQEQATNAPPRKRTILVVDDEDDLRKAIAFDFKRLGYDVIEANSGKAAIALVRTRPIDGVVSDVRMPDGDGLWLLQEIKKIDPHIPFLTFISGFTEATVEEAYDMGAETLLSKPFSREVLRRTVERSLLPISDRWAIKPASDPAVKIEQQYSSLQEIEGAGGFRFGRGGFFLAQPESTALLKSETVVRLSLKFKETADPSVEGIGIVRWCRPAPVEGRSRGIGVEILYVEDPYRVKLAELVTASRTHQFIPLK